jgi:hypothetical protein
MLADRTNITSRTSTQAHGGTVVKKRFRAFKAKGLVYSLKIKEEKKGKLKRRKE